MSKWKDNDEVVTTYGTIRRALEETRDHERDRVASVLESHLKVCNYEAVTDEGCDVCHWATETIRSMTVNDEPHYKTPLAGDTVDAPFDNAVYRYFEAQAELLLKKHRDYGPTNISRSPGGPLNGLRVRIHDKVARINHLLDSEALPENESLRDSFMDLANYAVIALLVIDDKWDKEKTE